MMDTDLALKVSVSGSSVYKAVAQYLKDSPEFKKAIHEKVENYLTSDALEESLEQLVKNELSGWVNYNIKDEVKKVIVKEVKEQISGMFSKGKIKDIFKKAMLEEL
jgi:ribosomal protein S3AE